MSRQVVAIDIGSYETKIIEGKKTNKGVIVNKAISILTPKNVYKDGKILDRELLSYLLKKNLKENRINSRITYLTIKSSLIITRKVFLPIIKEKDIEGILKYQLDEYLPVDLKKYIIQYKKIKEIEKSNIEKIKLFIAAVPKKIIHENFNLLKDVGLKPVVLDLQFNCVSKIIKYSNFINREYQINEYTFALIDLGFYTTSITIIKNSILQVNRIIKNEGVRILDKIKKVFDYYTSRENSNSIDMILLYGGGTSIENVNNYYLKYFNIPTETIKFLDKVNINYNLNKYLNCIGSIIRSGK